jgi:phosphatidyl-myo-inositol dimannoside synthase
LAARRRVLVISPDFPPEHGGIQNLVHRVVTHATEYEPRVVTFESPGADRFDDGLPFEVRRVPARPRIRPLAVLHLDAAAARDARSFRPDVVLCGHIVAAPAAWAIRRRRRIPVVQYLHADELVHRPRLARFAVRQAVVSIAVSRYTKELALRLGAEPDRVHVIPPGVDLPPAPPEERAAAPTIVTVGRLEDRFKGHDVVLRALPSIVERVPGLEWAVIGGGSLRGELERAAEDAGIAGNVRFLGAVSDAERDEWLDCAQVFVMPARLPPGGTGGEGFGIVYLEAGAHGLPVVAGAVGGTLDAVTSETGLLVDPTDERAVADAVCRLLGDPDLARRLGEGGRRWAEQHAWPRIAARVERILLAA